MILSRFRYRPADSGQVALRPALRTLHSSGPARIEAQATSPHGSNGDYFSNLAGAACRGETGAREFLAPDLKRKMR